MPTAAPVDALEPRVEGGKLLDVVGCAGALSPAVVAVKVLVDVKDELVGPAGGVLDVEQGRAARPDHLIGMRELASL